MRKKFVMPKEETDRLRLMLQLWLSHKKIRLTDRASIRTALGMGDGSVHALLSKGAEISPELYVRTVLRISAEEGLKEALGTNPLLGNNLVKGQERDERLEGLLRENLTLRQRVADLEACVDEVEQTLSRIRCIDAGEEK